MSDSDEQQRESVDQRESATEDLGPSEAEAESVRGGLAPPAPPAGPVPMPYPNQN